MAARAQTVTNGVQYINESGVGYAAIVTGQYTITGESVVVDNNTGADRRITLPLLSGVQAGSYTVTIKDGSGSADTSHIVVVVSDSNTIDGDSTYIIATAYGLVTLMATQTGWRVLTQRPTITEEQQFLQEDAETALRDSWEEGYLLGLG